MAQYLPQHVATAMIRLSDRMENVDDSLLRTQYKAYKRMGQMKVVVKAPTNDEMCEMEVKLNALDAQVKRKLAWAAVRPSDVGLKDEATNAAPVMLAVFGPAKILDPITGHLKLM